MMHFHSICIYYNDERMPEEIPFLCQGNSAQNGVF